VLTGAGTLDAHELVAADGAAPLQGTGTIRVQGAGTIVPE
jgi:hypothetical protein